MKTFTKFLSLVWDDFMQALPAISGILIVLGMLLGMIGSVEESSFIHLTGLVFALLGSIGLFSIFVVIVWRYVEIKWYEATCQFNRYDEEDF